MSSQGKCVVPACDFKERPFKKFHLFPKDPTLCQAWQDFCNLAEKPPGKFGICDRHFPDEAYNDSYKILGRSKKFWRLNKDAVPTLYGPVRIKPAAPVQETMVVEELPQIIMDTEELLPDSYVQATEETDYVESPCRLCLKEAAGEGSVNLFESAEGQTSVSKFLLLMYQIELEDSPDWPSLVCRECVSFMEQMIQFKENILSAHCALYRQLAPSVQCIESADDSSGEITEIAQKPRRRQKPPVSSQEANEFLRSKGLLKCIYCAEQQFNVRSLMEHMMEKHQLVGFIVCCGEKHIGRARVLDHVAFHLNNDTFQCQQCGKRCKNSADLRTHNLNNHHRSKSLVCETCGKVCSSVSRLKKHRLIHVPREARPLKCEYCGAGFIDTTAMRRHVERMHEIKERYKCEACDRSFSNRSTLWEHVNSIHKAKPSICELCGKTVKNLKLHMKTHTKESSRERPDNVVDISGITVNCPVCQQVFDQSEMRKHSLEHITGPSSFCPICNIRVKSGGTYRTHMDTHDNKEYPCMFCSRVFDTYRFRYNHIKSTHWEAHQQNLSMSRKNKFGNLKFKEADPQSEEAELEGYMEESDK